jgi:hypothetical protein
MCGHGMSMIASFLYRNRCFTQPSYSFRQEDTDGNAERCEAFFIQALLELPRRSCQTGCPLSAHEWALSPSPAIPCAFFTLHPVHHRCLCARFSVHSLNLSRDFFAAHFARQAREPSHVALRTALLHRLGAHLDVCLEAFVLCWFQASIADSPAAGP